MPDEHNQIETAQASAKHTKVRSFTVPSARCQLACAVPSSGEQQNEPRSSPVHTPRHAAANKPTAKPAPRPGLIRHVRGVQTALTGFAIDTEWSELGKHSASHLISLSRPRGHGLCDHNKFERWANILTSIPYAALGVRTIRCHKSTTGRHYGTSLIAVAAGSAVYHSSHGKYRALGRKIDYWAIAIASAALARASTSRIHKALTVSSVLLTPFQPFAVVAANGAAAETSFFHRGRRNPELQRPYKLHCAAAALGGVAFIGEEFWPKVPLIHATWHLMSAASLAGMGPLLLHAERSGCVN